MPGYGPPISRVMHQMSVGFDNGMKQKTGRNARKLTWDRHGVLVAIRYLYLITKGIADYDWVIVGFRRRAANPVHRKCIIEPSLGHLERVLGIVVTRLCHGRIFPRELFGKITSMSRHEQLASSLRHSG